MRLLTKAPLLWLSHDPSLVLAVHGPYLVDGPINLHDASATIKIAIQSGAGILASLGCAERLDTGSPHTVFDEMI